MIASVGYTEDGKVFMVVNAMVEKEPTQLVVTLTPKEASDVNVALTEAITKAVGYKGETIQ